MPRTSQLGKRSNLLMHDKEIVVESPKGTPKLGIKNDTAKEQAANFVFGTAEATLNNSFAMASLGSGATDGTKQ